MSSTKAVLVMPSRAAHIALDKLLFQRSYNKVHASKDRYAKVYGPSHRRYAHDPVSNSIIALSEYPKDAARAFAAATFHDLVDRETTRLKRRGGKNAKLALALLETLIAHATK